MTKIQCQCYSQTVYSYLQNGLSWVRWGVKLHSLTANNSRQNSRQTNQLEFAYSNYAVASNVLTLSENAVWTETTNDRWYTQTSAFEVYGMSWHISGAKQHGVPTNVEALSIVAVRRFAIPKSPADTSTILAKHQIFTMHLYSLQPSNNNNIYSPVWLETKKGKCPSKLAP